MSIEITYPFLIPGNYTFNSSEIEVSSGCRLSLQQSDIDFTESFLTDTGLVLDTDKAEWVGNPDYLIGQKDKRPANSIVGATFTNSMDASFAADGFGALTASLNGTPTLSSGKLSCIGANGIYYSSSLIGNLSGDFVLKFKYTPKYSGGPVANINIITLAPVSGGTNRIALFDNPAGLRLTANGLGAINLGTWSPVADNEYVFEVICLSNNLSIYIAGSQQGTTQTISPGQGTDAISLWIGAFTGLYNSANAEFDDIILYSSAAQTTVYTLPEYAYLESVVILPEMQHVGDGTIKLFNSFTTTESGSPRYTIQIGRSGNYLYWNGSAWAVSDGSYSQSNDAATFNTNCPTLSVNGEEYGQFKVLFPDSNIISSVSEITANMNVDSGYLTTNPSILVNATFRNQALCGFIETASKSGSDEIKYIVKKDTDFYWWSGSAWEVSDGTYAQSNTAADIYANMSTFTTSIVVSQIKIFLHSDDGSTTPELTTLDIFYDFAGETPDTINTCIVWGYSVTPFGVPVTDTIKIIMNKESYQYKTNILIRSEEITVTPDSSNGYWEVTLIETENMDSAARYVFDIGGDLYERQVPNEETKSFWDLVA